MKTQKSLRAHSLCLLATTVAALGVFALVPVSRAQTTAISSWTVNTGNYTSGLSTSNPILGDGATANSATNEQIYATIPTTYTLSIGDSITFSGNVSFSGLSSPGADSFRFGIYDSNGSTTANNWLGYFASNAGQSANYNGHLWEQKTGTPTVGFGSEAYATSLQTNAGSPASTASSTPFVDGNYTFSIEIERVSSTQVTIIWSLSSTIGGVYSVGGTVSNHTAVDQTFTFDRVGFYTNSALTNANEIAFSNLAVTYASAIPEPATTALLMGSALSLALLIPLRRRLRATTR